MRYALNSAVLTAPGDYSYRLLTRAAARAWWLAGPVEARIGYAETCAALGMVLDVAAPDVDRRAIRMSPGDEALVFRIALSPDARRLAVRDKGREGIARMVRDCEIGLLTRDRESGLNPADHARIAEAET